jgi:enolase
MKILICDTPKGQYSIPLELVARHRADYYSVEVDGNDIDSDEYNEEVQYAMNDDYECIDWILNNSDWEDWEKDATKLNNKVNVTDDDFWTSSDNFEIDEV